MAEFIKKTRQSPDHSWGEFGTLIGSRRNTNMFAQFEELVNGQNP